MKHQRILFARIGWMHRYEGPNQSGDYEKPIGGGKHNKKYLGYEVYNFKAYQGNCYGYVSCTNEKIKLSRIEQGAKDKMYLENILVIFVGTNPKTRGEFIVGWYENARVYATAQPYVDPDRQDGFNHMFQAVDENCTILPEENRTHRLPNNTDGHGYGNYNVRYFLEKNGQKRRKSTPEYQWMKKAIEYIEAGKYSSRKGKPKNRGPNFTDPTDWKNHFFSPERECPSQRGSKKPSTSSNKHGIVTNRLKDWLTKQGKRVEEIKNTQTIDLAVVCGVELLEIYEVKSTDSSQSIYAGIGQLLFHSRNDSLAKRFLVLPAGQDSNEVFKFLKRYQIGVLYFYKKNNIYTFTVEQNVK
ncbi:MAG: hypothetical protein OEY59_10455 [Deltaproteobacteria bacterium]|nr:hypothetical protein [Deltaproteobacteria bacterium]